MRTKNKTKRRVLSAVTILSVMAASLSGATSASAVTVDNSYNAGTYTGEGLGYGEDYDDSVIKVTVTLENADGNVAITDIQADGSTQTPRMWNKAIAILDTIKANNGTDNVDAVSGATLSSHGIIDAVNEALDKAKGSGIFESGRGTRGNPYMIKTADQLSQFALSVDSGTDYAGEYVALGADIDLSGTEWDPIGAEGRASLNTGKLFAGDFNGDYYTVSGLTISSEYSDEANIGLFSTLASSASVRNVILKDVNITASAAAGSSMAAIRAGGITGDTERKSGERGTMINGCSVSGSVSVSTTDGNAFAGGIAGRIFTYGAILNSASDTSVYASSVDNYTAAYAGGIAGMTGNNTVLANCVSFGNVEAKNVYESSMDDAYAGGIAGMLSSKTYNCYAAGNAEIAKNAAAPHNYAGVIAGQVSGSGEGNKNYYSIDASITVNIDGGETTKFDGAAWFPDSVEGIIEAAEDVSASEIGGQDFVNTLNGNLYYVFKTLNEEALTLREWELSEGRAVPSAFEWVNSTIDDTIFDSGSGSAEDPYIIKTADQLRAFAASLTDRIDYYEKYVELGADIDISGSDWSPVGGSYYAFDGSFDGKGYTISGMTEGTADSPRVLGGDSGYIGLFGILGSDAVVRDVKLTNLYINVTSPGTARVGGIAGRMLGSEREGDYRGAVIDGCSVSGEITSVQDDGNAFVAGIVGFNQKGAIINCRTDVKLSGTTLGEYIAEVGGIAGLLNRGLVANCYTLGSVYASGNRESSKEGMGAASGLVSVNGGTLTGSYSSGSHTTKELSLYSGAVSGWITGIGKAYNCFYNLDAPMVLNGQTVDPVGAVGTIIPGGLSDDSDLVFAGGLTDKLEGYTSENYAQIADKLNSYFAAYPADLSKFGLGADALKKWEYRDGEVTFADEKAEVIYSQPEAELVPEPELVLQDGDWYGRDQAQTTVVKITVESSDIKNIEVLSGDSEGDAYEEALYIAEAKSAYGDFTHYYPKDTSIFISGSGTEEDPYLVETEEQLRYISYAINDDVDWYDTWFLQTKDIELHGEFTPIGWAKQVNINHQWTTMAYMFRGNYDGGNHKITGLSIGSEDAPAQYFMAGLFGFTQGEWDNNLDPADGAKPVTLKNIHIEDAYVNIKSVNQTYAGGLLGDGQNGIVIDNCSVTGKVRAFTEEEHSRAGGLAASVLRGLVTDCWTDADVYAETNIGRAYSGGMFAMTNRVSAINCYTLGNTSGKASTFGVLWVGGIDAFSGGIKINCYSKGDETALTGTNGVGGINGLKGSISIDYLTYFNSDAKQEIAGKQIEENQSTGDNLTTPKATDEGAPKSAAEMSSREFVDLLNANAADMVNQIKRVEDELQGFYSAYYKGDGTDLNKWVLKDGTAVFEEQEPVNALPVYSYSVTDGEGGIKASVTNNSSDTDTPAFIVAQYDASGRLLSVSSQTLTLEKGASAEYTYKKAQDCTRVRPMLWINLEGAEPYKN